MKTTNNTLNFCGYVRFNGDCKKVMKLISELNQKGIKHKAKLMNGMDGFMPFGENGAEIYDMIILTGKDMERNVKKDAQLKHAPLFNQISSVIKKLSEN